MQTLRPEVLIEAAIAVSSHSRPRTTTHLRNHVNEMALSCGCSNVQFNISQARSEFIQQSNNIVNNKGKRAFTYVKSHLATPRKRHFSSPSTAQVVSKLVAEIGICGLRDSTFS